MTDKWIGITPEQFRQTCKMVGLVGGDELTFAEGQASGQPSLFRNLNRSLSINKVSFKNQNIKNVDELFSKLEEKIPRHVLQNMLDAYSQPQMFQQIFNMLVLNSDPAANPPDFELGEMNLQYEPAEKKVFLTLRGKQSFYRSDQELMPLGEIVVHFEMCQKKGPEDSLVWGFELRSIKTDSPVIVEFMQGKGGETHQYNRQLEEKRQKVRDLGASLWFFQKDKKRVLQALDGVLSQIIGSGEFVTPEEVFQRWRDRIDDPDKILKSMDLSFIFPKIPSQKVEETAGKFESMSSQQVATKMGLPEDFFHINNKEITFEFGTSKKMSAAEAERFRMEFLGGKAAPLVKMESSAPGKSGLKVNESRIMPMRIEIDDMPGKPVSEKKIINFCTELSRTADGKYQGMVYVRPDVREDLQHLLLLPAIAALQGYRDNIDPQEKDYPIKISGKNPLMVAIMIEYCQYKGYPTEVPEMPAEDMMAQAKAIVGKLSGGPAPESPSPLIAIR